MENSLKTIALKSILYRYANPKNKSQNAEEFVYLCDLIFNAMDILGLKEFSIRELMDFKYIVSLVKKLPDNSLIKNRFLLLLGMKQNLTYDNFPNSYQYNSLAMQHVYFSMQPSTYSFKKKRINFEFSINLEYLNFDLKVDDQIINGEIEHLNEIKSYILENNIDTKKENALMDVCNHIKMMKY